MRGGNFSLFLVDRMDGLDGYGAVLNSCRKIEGDIPFLGHLFNMALGAGDSEDLQEHFWSGRGWVNHGKPWKTHGKCITVS